MILLPLIAKYVTAAFHKQIFPLVACKGYYKSRSCGLINTGRHKTNPLKIVLNQAFKAGLKEPQFAAGR
jgi:hypothetical protein